MTIKIGPEQFADRLREVENQVGYQLSPTSGVIAQRGVKATYEYDGKGELQITILEKPFFVSIGYIQNQILAWFAGH